MQDRGWLQEQVLSWTKDAVRRSVNQHFAADGLEIPPKAPEGSGLLRRVFPLFGERGLCTLDTFSHVDVSDVFVLVLDAVHAAVCSFGFVNGREI